MMENSKLLSPWLSSARELKQVRNVVFCGLMCALAIVLNSVATIRLGPFIKIGFSGMPNRVVDMLFGPAVGAAFGVVLDFLKYFSNPDGPFFPGFAISAMAGGIIYGYAFYNHRITLLRVAAANLLVKLFVNVGLNTFWLHMLYNKGILAIVPARIVSNLIQLPVDTLLYFLLLRAVKRILSDRMAAR